MKSMTTFVLLFSLIATTAYTAEVNVWGSWTLANPIVSKTGPILLQIDLSENQMSLTASCEFQAKDGEQAKPETLSTTLATAIELTSTEIKILEEQTAIAEDGLKACRAFVIPTSWEYSLSEDGDRMAVDAIIPYMQRLIFVRK